jgi:short-subunit dehydrogenase
MTSTQTRPLALVTGASSGIGLELAKQFAQHDYDLLINAEDVGIDAASAELRSGGAEVRVVRADLSSEDGVDQLWRQIAEIGRPLDAAALNAGLGQGGPFLETDLSQDLEIIDVNVRSTVRLAKHVLREMAARGQGNLLITSSIASTMPGPFQAVYSASKSFLQSFAQGLQNELKDTGITVTSLMPGATETNFFHRAQMDDTKLGQSDKDDPAAVAKQGFAALMRGKDRAVAASAKPKLIEAVNKVLPDKVKAAAHRQMTEPGSAKNVTDEDAE